MAVLGCVMNGLPPQLAGGILLFTRQGGISPPPHHCPRSPHTTPLCPVRMTPDGKVRGALSCPIL